MTCSRPNMAGTCASMVCQFECLPGFIDLDMDLDTGCEYLCVETNGGVEACDFTDNDCDGETDEGLDLETDVDNCGACGRPCIVLNATPSCVDGVCTHSACDDGFADVIDGVPGCEYACPVSPTEDETCDARDEDCDGAVDELPIAGLGDPCIPPEFAAFGDRGECAAGADGCIFGTPACIGYVGPTGESCDGLDNDCDDVIDNGFDKDNDPRNCGPDCTPCAFDDGIAGCSGGVCELVACDIGFVNADGDDSNGCEYECSATGPEVLRRRRQRLRHARGHRRPRPGRSSDDLPDSWRMRRHGRRVPDRSDRMRHNRQVALRLRRRDRSQWLWRSASAGSALRRGGR